MPKYSTNECAFLPIDNSRLMQHNLINYYKIVDNGMKLKDYEISPALMVIESRKLFQYLSPQTQSNTAKKRII
jgi:hypothetical protein